MEKEWKRQKKIERQKLQNKKDRKKHRGRKRKKRIEKEKQKIKTVIKKTKGGSRRQKKKQKRKSGHEKANIQKICVSLREQITTKKGKKKTTILSFEQYILKRYPQNT